jgi:ribosomal-protein-alanine N-acetyltransferase
MVEAISTFVNHSFNEVGLVRIQAKCMVQNDSSEKLMKRVGMEFEGVLRKCWIYKGVVLDAKIFAITN